MVTFRPTCRQCFLERGQTILLVEGNHGEWTCPVDSRHVTNDDVEVA